MICIKGIPKRKINLKIKRHMENSYQPLTDGQVLKSKIKMRSTYRRLLKRKSRGIYVSAFPFIMDFFLVFGYLNIKKRKIYKKGLKKFINFTIISIVKESQNIISEVMECLA